MKMESFFSFITLFSLLLAANTINARKDMGEYWKGITKDETMAEAASSTASKDKPNCHTSETFEFNKHRNFGEVRIDITRNYNDVKPSNKDHSLADDFGLKKHKNFGEDPIDATITFNDIKPSNKDHTFVDDFEPRPNVPIYTDDSLLKESKSFASDFEPRPNLSIYDNDTGLKEDKSHVKDFEPRPDATIVYN